MSREETGNVGTGAAANSATRVKAHGLRDRAAEQKGFSLIELLVVILVLGILAAIAIPSFIGQKSKATNVQAKELVRTAETTAETMGTESGGHYDAVSLEGLKHAEPAINETSTKKEAWVSAATGHGNEYSVTATSAEGNEFTISRSANGSISRECKSATGKKACAGGEASSW